MFLEINNTSLSVSSKTQSLHAHLNALPTANKNYDILILQRRPKHEPPLGHVRDPCQDFGHLCTMTGVFEGEEEDLGDRTLKGDGIVVEDDMVHLHIAPNDGFEGVEDINVVGAISHFLMVRLALPV